MTKLDLIMCWLFVGFTAVTWPFAVVRVIQLLIERWG